MKKKMMITMLALTLAIAPLVLAEEAHHAASEDSSTAQMDMGNKMDSSMMEMKEMRLKMSSTEGDSERNKLMHEHMQMMRNGMQMMDQGNMMGKQTMGEMPMSDQMPMMEKKMEMMGGNGMCHMMMMMEKKMQMMQEMLNGMMTQQEMLMKNK